MSLEELRFTEKHEWVKVEGELAIIGISEFAQKEFGDIVYVELPSIGDTIKKGEGCVTIESVKAVEDCYAPISGEVTEVNNGLESSPEKINKDPYGEGWILKAKIENSKELETLMDYNAYKDYLKGIEE